MDGESNDEWDIHHSLGFHGKCLKTSTRQITLSSPTLLHVLNANGGFSDGAFLLYSETRLLMSRCTRLQSLRFPLLHETSSDFLPLPIQWTESADCFSLLRCLTFFHLNTSEIILSLDRGT